MRTYRDTKPAPIKNQNPSTHPGIPKPILFALLFYLGTLMVTQTAYGWGFMTLRWVALSVLTSICGLYWLFHLSSGKYRWDTRGLPYSLIIFLAATMISVFNSENISFSALRWLSNAMLLLTCIVFLRAIFSHMPSHQILMILKIVTFLLLIISLWAPAPKSALDSAYFRGAMTDPNSLGHVAVISALVCLHGAITSSSRLWRRVQGFIAVFSIAILASTFARSSMTALLVGILIMSLYYGVTRSLFSKALIFLLITFIFVTPTIQTRILGFIGKADPMEHLTSTIVRLDEPLSLAAIPASIFISRESLWTDAWEGFAQRPLLGWGFSMNKDTPRTWVIGVTAIGMVRDATNDFLFILEGCGILGLLGYVCLIVGIWRQPLSPAAHKAIQRGMKKRIPLAPGLRRNSLRTPPASLTPMTPPGRSDEKASESESAEDSRSHTHAIAYILSVSLWVLFLSDGSAFSPGSLIAAIFWITTGVAAALWSTAMPQQPARAFPFLRRRPKSPSPGRMSQSP